MRKAQKQSKAKKALLFTAAALIAAVCGYWLLTSPAREREHVESIQESMMEDLMRDIIEAEQPLTDAEDVADFMEYEDLSEIEEVEEVDDLAETDGDYLFEDCNGYEYDYTAYNPEPAYIPAFDPIFSDPVPDNAFPANIVGIGILTIDSIDLRLPIAEGIEYATLRIAPGRVPQTAQIGDIGNAVIAGHRNYAFGSMFNRLGEIEIGDILQYQARNGELMEFEVFEIAVIEPENQIAFLQPLNKSIITLYTCTPTRVATHRLLIRAERIQGGVFFEENH